MANSIGDVNVRIVADATSVGPATQQAQRQFNQFSQTVGGGMRNINTLSQQAVFAVDDFFASFSTGGVAGGIRGAANNLTLIASMLGGVKVQLAAIAAVTIGGFLAKQFFDGSKAAKNFSKDVKEAATELERQLNLREHLAGAGPGRASSLDSALAAMQSAQANLISSQTAREDLLRNPAVTDRLSGKELSEEEQAARKQQEDMLNERIKRQEDILAIATREYETQQGIAFALKAQEQASAKRSRELRGPFRGISPFAFITGEHVGNMRMQASEIDAQIAELRDSLITRFSVGELFNRFGQAHQMGSVGAVSTINSAQYGSQNVQQSLLREEQESNRTQKRIEQLLKKKATLEVVTL